MDFGMALIACKAGSRISRASWDGPGQWVTYRTGYPDGVEIDAGTAQATGIRQGTVCRFAPYLLLCDAQGVFVPWQPGQGDVLADDWRAGPALPPG